MANWEEFQQTREYKLWNNLRETCELLEINDNKLNTMKDLCDYWEPFLERIFKLGILFKQTAKLKEIKMNWIRPIFSFPSSETGDKITFDGKTYDIQKDTLDKAQEILKSLKSLILVIYENDKLDSVNYKKSKKTLQDATAAFFKPLNFFVTKKLAGEIHNLIKTIIKPLRDLIKANYHLFLLEKKEEGDLEITLFQDKKDVKLFTDNLNQFFVDEEIKMKRDVEMDIFEDYLNKNQTKEAYQYNFYPKQRENFVNSENFSIKRQILQKKFEDGLQGLLKYLYEKKKDDFYIEINVNKLFKNLEIPQVNELKSTKFFIGQMQSLIKELKERLYEMKINGVSRMKMPVTENVELIQRIKKIYDLHLLIDNLMGDKLKYDQFIFIYNHINFIVESNLKEDIVIFKEKNFMEEAIPKYIILSALKNSVQAINKMKEKLKEKNKIFSMVNFQQIKNLKLGSEDNYIINAFELNENNKKFLTPQLEEFTKKINDEIKDCEGRFWILEEFFNPEDSELWLEAVNILKDINLMVIDDIRDYILLNYEHSNPVAGNDVGNKTSSNNIQRMSSSKKLTSQKSSKKLKDNRNISPSMKTGKASKKIGLSDISRLDKSDSEDDVFIANNKGNHVNLDNLRAPLVWNFPVDLVMKKMNGEKKPEVRHVDPRNFYKDGRVNLFLDILIKIKNKMIEYCNAKKPNKWVYFFENVLRIHGITYNYENKNANSNINANLKKNVDI